MPITEMQREGDELTSWRYPGDSQINQKRDQFWLGYLPLNLMVVGDIVFLSSLSGT